MEKQPLLKLSQHTVKTKIHIVISVVLVLPAALIYGFTPDWLLQLSESSTDQKNMNKAIMGLYLAFAFLWIFGLYKSSFLRIAQISVVVFMIGLGVGRVFSFISDGIPSMAFAVGTIGELLLGLYGIWVLCAFQPKNQ